MRLIEMDGLKPWWECQCPACNRYLSFLNGANLAFCSWPRCHGIFTVKYEYKLGKVDWAILTPRPGLIQSAEKF